MYTNRLTGHSSDLINSRTCIIPVPVVHIGIVDNDCVIVNVPVSVPVVTRIPVVIDISLRYKYPVEIRDSSDINIDINTGTQRCPAIIATTTSPAHPCRSPSGIRNPYPASSAAVMPSAIVEWCPSPFVIGYPGVSIFSHFPMTICVIRSKLILIYIRAPYITILRVIYPYSIRRQFLIKCFKRNVVILSFYLCR